MTTARAEREIDTGGPAEDPRFVELSARLSALPGAIVAFSGGVDSAMLLHASVTALGAERVVAVTARSPSLPQRELADAIRIAREIGAVHRVIDTAELESGEYRRNGPDRCYHCKAELFDVLARTVVRDTGWPVLYGAIADDALDHRPGARAAAERGVLAPLAECGIDKRAVRDYCRTHGLGVADKPSSACLASRVPYGTAIDVAILRRIEHAEAVLRGLGFHQLRVRDHGRIARVEVPVADFGHALAERLAIVDGLRALGYTFVALDLGGFRSGSMNEVST